jgi:uncharacterized membrane protein HdeD (DUF308 family)
MVVQPFLISPIFTEFLLPFALIFTLIFAILQKTKLLGDGKKQIDAIIGLVVGLILIATPPARYIVVSLMPFLAVAAVILLVFMLLYGFIGGKTSGDVLGIWWKRAFATILAVSLVGFLLMITGYWDAVRAFVFNADSGTSLWVNGLLIAIIVGAIVAVIKGDVK